MQLPKTMRAARMYDVGADMTIEEVPTPQPGDLDVVIKVHACNVVPNLGNVLKNWTSWFPQLPLPNLPATFGLDAAGKIAAVGSGVTSLKPGTRVYANPGRSCGSCAGRWTRLVAIPMFSKAILASLRARRKPMIAIHGADCANIWRFQPAPWWCCPIM